MKKLLVILFLLVAFPLCAETWDGEPNCTTNPELCHYIYDLAGGTADGSSWTNAFTDLPSTFTRGHKYYVADGSYGSHTFSSAESSTTYIYIKKATTTDHGDGTGWLDSMGDGTATFLPWIIQTGYWIFDGQTRGSDWKSNYGIKINDTNVVDAVNVENSDIDNLKFYYIEMAGHSADFEAGTSALGNATHGTCTTGDADGKVLTDSGQSWTTDQWVGYSVWNVTDGSGCRVGSNTDTTVTCQTYSTADDLEAGYDNKWEVGDVYYFWLHNANLFDVSDASPNTNVAADWQIKYCYLHHASNTFIYVYYADGWTISDNYFDRNHGMITYGNHGPGIMCRSCSDISVFNNVFTNIDGQGPMVLTSDDSGFVTRNIYVYNNIFERGSRCEYSAISGIIGNLTAGGTIDGLYVYNNTIAGYTSGTYANISLKNANNNINIINNLFYNNLYCKPLTGVGATNVTTDYNAYIQCGSYTAEAHSVNGEGESPFTNVNNSDYTLAAGSSVEDEGTDAVSGVLTTDKNGTNRTTNYDIGAYEYTASLDNTKPTVDAFTIPETAMSLTLTISSFTCSDAIGVTGYCVNESAEAPTAGSCSGSGWAVSAQSAYTASTDGEHTLYGWCKDAAGNISTSANDTTTITLQSATTSGCIISAGGTGSATKGTGTGSMTFQQ